MGSRGRLGAIRRQATQQLGESRSDFDKEDDSLNRATELDSTAIRLLDHDMISAMASIPRKTLLIIDDAFAVLDLGLLSTSSSKDANDQSKSTTKQNAKSTCSGAKSIAASKQGFKSASSWKFKEAVSGIDQKYKVRKAQEVTQNIVGEFKVPNPRQQSSSNSFVRSIPIPTGNMQDGQEAQDKDDKESEFRQWAMGSLSLSEETDGGWMSEEKIFANFQENITHKMLCWDVYNGERHKASERPNDTAPSSKFKEAAQGLFGLKKFLTVHQRRRSRWGNRSKNSYCAQSEFDGNFKSISSSLFSDIEDPVHEGDLMFQDSSELGFNWEMSLWTNEEASSSDKKASRLPSLGQTRDVCSGASLRRPPAFVEPHRELAIQDAQHTPEFAYFRHCDKDGRVPFASVWRCFSDGVVDASCKSVNDLDLQVITKTVLDCTDDDQAMKGFDASGNQISDHGLHCFVKGLLSHPKAGDSIMELNFANNPMAMRSEAMISDLSRALGALPNLLSLNLSGVLLSGWTPESAASPSSSPSGSPKSSQGSRRSVVSVLCTALGKQRKLQNINFSNTGMGRYSQEACTSIGKLMGICPDLKHVDLSGNFFRHEGFAAVAASLKSSRLSSLSFARNSGVAGKTSFQHFNAIQILCESLQYNQSLEMLDISDTGSDADTAFCLEDALAFHPHMRSLDISGNPLGGSGLRALLRTLLGGKSEFESCKVEGHRDQAGSSNMVRFRHAHPDGSYRLNLAYPSQRALLRVLLKLSEKVRDREQAFRMFKHDGKPCRVLGERDKERGGYTVPAYGVCSFSFSLSTSRLTAVKEGNGRRFPAVRGDPRELPILLREARIRVSAVRYPIVRAMFAGNLTAEQQKRFIHACSKDLLFNHAQVAQLCKDRPEISQEVISSLFPSVEGKSSQLLLLSGVEDRVAIDMGKKVANCLWFQQMNPTGHYRLDLQHPSDHAVAETCLLVNTWEVEVVKSNGKPDVSQKGNFEMLRNEAHNEKPFVYGPEWNLPDSGQLTFDYMSPRRPPPGQRPISEVNCLHMIEALHRSTAKDDAKLKALWALSVRMYVSASQLRTLLAIVESRASKRDLFCMLFCRVTDFGKLLSTEVLHSDKVFTNEDRQILLHRLGHLCLFNPLAPECTRYHCLLSVYEQRMVIECLVQLTLKEPGINFHDSVLNGSLCVVPATWSINVPLHNQLFECNYQAATPNMAARRALLEKYVGSTYDGDTK